MNSDSKDHFVEGADTIIYCEGRSALAGALCVGFACISLLAAFAMVAIMGNWDFSLSSILFVGAALLFGVFAVMLMLLAVAALRGQHVIFNKIGRRISGRARGKLWLMRQIDVPFSGLRMPTLRTHELESSGPMYEISLELTDGQMLKLGGFDDRRKAELWCERIAKAIVSR